MYNVYWTTSYANDYKNLITKLNNLNINYKIVKKLTRYDVMKIISLSYGFDEIINEFDPNIKFSELVGMIADGEIRTKSFLIWSDKYLYPSTDIQSIDLLERNKI